MKEKYLLHTIIIVHLLIHFHQSWYNRATFYNFASGKKGNKIQ